MKIAVAVTLSLLLLALGGFWYLKHDWKRSQPLRAPAITQKETSPIDLRPAAIAKLQQLVAAGSDSLYQVRIDSLQTDIPSGTIVVKGVHIMADEAVVALLRRRRKLPDDLFDISFESLRVSGITLADLLHRRNLSVRSVSCTLPKVIVHHELQPYNKDVRARASRTTLFSRFNGKFDRLAIDSISFFDGSITDHNGSTTNVYREVSLLLRDVLIDSASERDETRFLFAKKSVLRAGSITVPMGGGHYDLSLGGIIVNGETKELAIRNLSMKPRGGREALASQQKDQTIVFDISMPALTFHHMDWWAAAHGEALLADDAVLSGAYVTAYYDKRKPKGPPGNGANFPQQMLQDVASPISVKRVMINNATFTYEEYTARSNRQSSFYFTGITSVMENVTNVASEVNARPVARFKGNGRFMNVAPMTADIGFQLPRNRRGAFSADFSIGSMGTDQVNTFAKGMGLVEFTSGHLERGTAHVDGNNANMHGKVAIAYTDLHITPLKETDNAQEKQRKKPVHKILGNVLFIKNNNPSKGEDLRVSDFSLDHTNESNFFNFLWLSLKSGMLKTIGVPQKYGM